MLIATMQDKGGTGKTTVSANLALAFAQRGYKVALIDGDRTQGNIGQVMGIPKARYSLKDVMKGLRHPSELAYRKYGVDVIQPGLSISDFIRSGDRAATTLLKTLKYWEDKTDICIYDCPAGVDRGVLPFARAAAQALVVLFPERSSEFGTMKSIEAIARANLSDFLDELLKQYYSLEDAALACLNIKRYESYGRPKYKRVDQVLADKFQVLKVEYGEEAALKAIFKPLEKATAYECTSQLENYMSEAYHALVQQELAAAALRKGKSLESVHRALSRLGYSRCFIMPILNELSEDDGYELARLNSETFEIYSKAFPDREADLAGFCIYRLGTNPRSVFKFYKNSTAEHALKQALPLILLKGWNEETVDEIARSLGSCSSLKQKAKEYREKLAWLQDHVANENFDLQAAVDWWALDVDGQKAYDQWSKRRDEDIEARVGKDLDNLVNAVRSYGSIEAAVADNSAQVLLERDRWKMDEQAQHARELYEKFDTKPLGITVNKAKNRDEAEATYDLMKRTAADTPQSVTTFGYVQAYDDAVSQAVNRGVPLMICAPKSHAAEDIGFIADNILKEYGMRSGTSQKEGTMERLAKYIYALLGK